MSKTNDGEIILDAKTMEALQRIAEAPNTPDDAFAAAELTRKDLQSVVHLLPLHQRRMLEDYLSGLVVLFDETPAAASEENKRPSKLLDTNINDIELTVRAANALNNASIVTVGQLVEKTEANLRRYRNVDARTLDEIKIKLQEMGLSLGMTNARELQETPEVQQAQEESH